MFSRRIPIATAIILGLIVVAFLLSFAAACTGQTIVHRPLAQKIELNRNARKLKEIKGTESQLGPGEWERYIQVDGRRRRYELHVPKSYRASEPMPLILNFHGGGSRGGIARLQTQMDDKADSAGFIVAYLDGAGSDPEKLLTWNAGSCCGYAMDNDVDDVQFVDEMLDDVAKFFSIDEDAVFATGHSNGAMMSHRLACELSERIAAVAPVGAPLGLSRCQPSRPISVMHMHGTADQNAPFDGGVGPNARSQTNFMSVEKCIADWVARVGADKEPEVRTLENEATMTTYRAEDGTEIVLVAIDGMGHTWPGGHRMAVKSHSGEMSRNINANDLMWEFFQRHRFERPAADDSLAKRKDGRPKR